MVAFDEEMLERARKHSKSDWSSIQLVFASHPLDNEGVRLLLALVERILTTLDPDIKIHAWEGWDFPPGEVSVFHLKTTPITREEHKILGEYLAATLCDSVALIGIVVGKTDRVLQKRFNRVKSCTFY